MLERVQYLLDKRIIREITPIFDTRAFGYASMLVAAKVDPRAPAPRRAVHQHASGRHAQLPARPRVQPVVHDRRRARLPARPRGDARRDGRAHRRGVDPPAADAEAVQDPHGPGDGGRHRRAAHARARPPSRWSSSRSTLTEEDIATVRATQGPMPVVAEPYAPAAERLGVPGRDRARAAGVAARARRPAPRRRDPLPPPRRLLGQRHGRLGGAGGRDPRDRASGWPRSAASRTATSARPTPTGPTPCSRWPTAAPRRSATRSSTRSPRRPASASARRCTRAPSSRRCGCSTSPTRSRAGKRSTRR